MATSHLDSMLLSSVKGLSEMQRGEDQLYPSYMDNDKYIQFLKQGLKTQVQENESGYVSILLDKEVYVAGDVIVGSVIIDLFNPSSCKDIFIQFKGVTKMSQQVAQLVNETAQKSKKGFRRSFDLKPNNLYMRVEEPAENEEIMIGFDDHLSRRESLKSRGGNQHFRQHSLRSG